MLMVGMMIGIGYKSSMHAPCVCVASDLSSPVVWVSMIEEEEV